MLIQERGFKPSMILCKEFWSLVQHHRWEHFYITPKDTTRVLVLQEFYASFRDQELRKPYAAISETITVRGEKVPIILREI